MSDKIATSYAWDSKDYIWFYGRNYNGLFRIEKKSSELEWVTSLPMEKLLNKRLSIGIITYEDKIVVPSWGGELRISIYDCTKDIWRVIEFSKTLFGGKFKYSGAGFHMCIPYEKYVYVIGHMVPIVIRIDMENYNIKFIEDWKENVGIEINEMEIDKFIFAQGSVEKNVAYIPCGFTNAFLELNLETTKSRIVYIPTNVKAFNEGTFINGEIWITGLYEALLVIYSIEDKAVTEICLEHNTDNISPLFYRPIDFGDKVLIFAAKAKHSYWVDKKTKQVSICTELDKKVTEDSYIYANFFLAKSNRDVHYWSLIEEKWYVFNVDTCKKRIINTELPKSFKQELIREKYNRKLMESREHTLKNYIVDCQKICSDKKCYNDKIIEEMVLEEVVV